MTHTASNENQTSPSTSCEQTSGRALGTAITVVAMAALLSACGGGGGGDDEDTPAAPTGAEIAWKASVVFQPGATTATTMAALANQKAAPVMVVMHGCTGVDGMETWGPSLAELGYIVIMPDSLARPDRAGRFTCTGLATAVGNLDIYDKRIEELEYAIAQVRREPWYDGRHLVALGVSEGGFTVARKSYAGLSAAIVSAYWCTGIGALSVGTVAPTLSINYSQDPFYYNMSTSAGAYGVPSCSGGLPGSSHVVLPGAHHSAYATEEGKQILLDFARVQATR